MCADNDFFAKAFGTSNTQNLFNLEQGNPTDEILKNTEDKEIDKQVPPDRHFYDEDEDIVSDLASIESYLLTKQCSTCGKMNEEIANFCSICGGRFSNVSERTHTQLNIGMPEESTVIVESDLSSDIIEKNQERELVFEQTIHESDIKTIIPLHETHEKPKPIYSLCSFSSNGMVLNTGPTEHLRQTETGLKTQIQPGKINILKHDFYPGTLLAGAPFPLKDKKIALGVVLGILDTKRDGEKTRLLWKYAEYLLKPGVYKFSDIIDIDSCISVEEEIFKGEYQSKRISKNTISLMVNGKQDEILQKTQNIILSLCIALSKGLDKGREFVIDIFEREIHKGHPIRPVLFAYLNETTKAIAELKENKESSKEYWKFILASVYNLNTSTRNPLIRELAYILEESYVESHLCHLISEGLSFFDTKKMLIGDDPMRKIINENYFESYQLTEIFNLIQKEKYDANSSIIEKERFRVTCLLVEAGNMDMTRSYCKLLRESSFKNESKKIENMLSIEEDKQTNRFGGFWNAIDTGLSKIIGLEEEKVNKKETFDIQPSFEEEQNMSTHHYGNSIDTFNQKNISQNHMNPSFNNISHNTQDGFPQGNVFKNIGPIEPTSPNNFTQRKNITNTSNIPKNNQDSFNQGNRFTSIDPMESVSQNSFTSINQSPQNSFSQGNNHSTVHPLQTTSQSSHSNITHIEVASQSKNANIEPVQANDQNNLANINPVETKNQQINSPEIRKSPINSTETSNKNTTSQEKQNIPLLGTEVKKEQSTPSDKDDGLLKKFKGLFSFSSNPEPQKETTKADLGNESEFYYDEAAGRWVHSDKSFMKEKDIIPPAPLIPKNINSTQSQETTTSNSQYYDIMNQSQSEVKQPDWSLPLHK